MLLRKNAKAEMLHRVPLFAECSKKQLGDIAAIADELAMPEGRVLAKQGDRGREFLVLVDGAADVTIDGEKVATLGPGDFFGEMALITHAPRAATVTATWPVRLLVITDRAFERLLRTDPGIQAKILAAVAARAAANEAREQR